MTLEAGHISAVIPGPCHREARGMGTRDVGAVDGRRARVRESGGVRTRRARVVVFVASGVRVEDVASGVRV